VFLLKAQWELLGLKAPVFSWVVSAGLLAYCIRVYLKHRREFGQRARFIYGAEKKLKSLRGKDITSAGNGISRQFYDAITEIFNGLPLLRAQWQGVSSSIIRRPGKNGEDRFWISEEIGNFFNETSMLDNHAYKTAPTIITGVGLLATFLAILVALLDVKLSNNRVQGLDLLVQGLSGKFLSSVVALACATLLVYLEKGVMHPARAAITSLTLTLGDLLPRLVPAQVLSDLHREITSQSGAFKTFNADLTFKLKQSFSESLGPTLQRMVTAVDDLNRFMRNVEAQKNEQINRQPVLSPRAIEQSMEFSLEKAGDRFINSFTASAQGQLNQVMDLLANTATLLEQMNSQFVLNQNVFNDLINVAKNVTTDQITAREAQVEQLTGVLSELMHRLQEKTGESMGSMQRSLAAITGDISNKVMDLSAQMAATVEEASERSTKRAKEVLDEAGSLSSRSAQHLARLLEMHSIELNKVEDLRTLLDGTLKELTASINRHGTATESLQNLTSEVNIGVASLSQIAKSIRETQEVAVRISSSASGQIGSLKSFTEGQQAVWGKVQTSMLQYEQVFEKVEGHAKDLLTQIAQYLGGYSDITQKHFIHLTSAADNFISQATGRLAGSIDELGEQLDDLNSAVANIVRASQTVR
jgi:hypothetical protein